MHEAFQIVAQEKVKKESLNQSFAARRSIKNLVQSKRMSEVNDSKVLVLSKPVDFTIKSKQEGMLVKLEAKYAKL